MTRSALALSHSIQPEQRTGRGRTPARRRGQILPRARFAPPLTESVAIQELSERLDDLQAGEIASAANGTKEAAKGWRLGKTMPRSVHLINLAKNIPEIRDWLIGEITANDDHPESERNLDKLASALVRHLELRGRID